MVANLHICLQLSKKHLKGNDYKIQASTNQFIKGKGKHVDHGQYIRFFKLKFSTSIMSMISSNKDL